jgi:hypothetical protein
MFLLVGSTMWGATLPLLACFLHLLSTAPSMAVAALGSVSRMLVAPAWLCARQPHIALVAFSLLSCLLWLASRQLCRWRRGRSPSEEQKRHKNGSMHHAVLRIISFLFLSWLTLCFTAYTTSGIRDFVFGPSVESLLSQHTSLLLKSRVRLLYESDQLGAESDLSRRVVLHSSHVSFPPDWVSGGAHSVKAMFCEKLSTFTQYTSLPFLLHCTSQGFLPFPWLHILIGITHTINHCTYTLIRLQLPCGFRLLLLLACAGSPDFYRAYAHWSTRLGGARRRSTTFGLRQWQLLLGGLGERRAPMAAPW